MNSMDMLVTQAVSAQAKSAQSAIMSSREDKALLSACRDFEALFIKQMLNSMRETIPDTSAENDNYGKEIYEDMLYTEYAQKMAKTARLGIADMLYNQMTK